LADLLLGCFTEYGQKERAMTTKGRIAIVGAGLMGTVIAALCAARGHQVGLYDENRKSLDGFADRARPILSQLAENKAAQDEILGRIKLHDSLESCVQGATLVHEIIHEDLEAKRALFLKLDAICAGDVMLATNTSSFLLSEICADIPGRQRVIGIHYVAPAHLIQAVEIITADFTAPEFVARAQSFLETIDHVGIVCRECPGFIINRIQYALKAEVQKILEEGVSTVHDIDMAVRLSIGPRLALWGPMMQEDLSTSKKTIVAVMDYIFKATGNAHFAPPAVLKNLAESGQIGASAGAGWYRWDSNNDQRVRERDRQLGDLLSWLKKNNRVSELGSLGENVLVKTLR
jgi:3-hydroxybutyryl-CoA dehydrogenase